MTKFACILLLAVLSLTSAAIAQPYYQAPPVVVYAQPPPAYALGGLVGGIVSLPFQFLGGLFGVSQAAIVPDGMGGWVPAANSTYDPVTGQFMPPQKSQWGGNNPAC